MDISREKEERGKMNISLITGKIFLPIFYINIIKYGTNKYK